jgi:ribonuclease E
VSKVILIDAAYPEETRVVIHENNLIQDFDYEALAKKQIKGNIYLAKVTRVEPSLQAAFIDYGGGKNGFLPFSEIHQDYFNIPISDRKSSDDHIASEQAEASKIEINNTLKSIDPPKISTEYENNAANIETIAEDHTEQDQLLSNIELQDTEDLIEEDGEIYIKRSNSSNNPYKNYRIQEVIKKNQVILVQAIKEERGNKGASFTSYISLAGRYCVLMPNSDKQSGVSKRIDDFEDRKRLKSIIAGLSVPNGVSVIIRTAGFGRNQAEIVRDYDYLVRLWNNIRDHVLSSKAPSFIHAEGDLIKRTFRDLYDSSIDEVLIQGKDSFKKAREFVKMIIPTHINKIKQYTNKVPIFSKYQIDGQISALYSPIAELKSGGYIVINQTEALISVDVNSGRSTSERNIEETATKTNMEAAYEIARQLKLRDLSGLIVIDFIDMLESRNRRLIEKSMREALKHDRAKIQIGLISNFGLMEMSRQRLRPSFIEANTLKCGYCNGKGVIRAPEANTLLILRTIENEICKGDYEIANVYVHPDVALYMLNNKRSEIEAIEVKYRTKILFYQDHKSTNDSFSIERVRKAVAAKDNVPMNVDPIYDDGSIIDEEEVVVLEPVKLEKHAKPAKRNWRQKIAKTPSVEAEQKLPNTTGSSPHKRIQRKPYIANVESANGVEPINIASNRINKRRKFHREGLPYNNAETEASSIPANKTGETSLLKDLWRKIID